MKNINLTCPICSHQEVADIFTQEYERDRSVFKYYRCRQCLHVFLHPLPPEWKIKSYNENQHNRGLDKYQVYRDYIKIDTNKKVIIDKKFLDPCSRILNLAFSYCQCNTNQVNYLDIGFGTGVYLSIASKRGWNVYGLDTDQHAYEFVKSYVPTANLAIGLFPEDTYKLSLKTVHICAVSHVLEHIIDVNHFFRELNGIMAEGGILYIAIPNIYCHPALSQLDSWILLGCPIHVQHFSLLSLQFLLNQYNWITVQVESGLKPSDQQIKIIALKSDMHKKEFNKEHTYRMIKK